MTASLTWTVEDEPGTSRIWRERCLDPCFPHEIDESDNDTILRLDGGLAAAEQWLGDRGGQTVSMAVSRESVHDVVRLSGVYLPPEKRKHDRAHYALKRFLLILSD